MMSATILPIFQRYTLVLEARKIIDDTAFQASSHAVDEVDLSNEEKKVLRRLAKRIDLLTKKIDDQTGWPDPPRFTAQNLINFGRKRKIVI